MREERPIVFTITEEKRTDSLTMLKVYTKHERGSQENVEHLYPSELFATMADISEVLNDEGYAVLFEVD